MQPTIEVREGGPSSKAKRFERFMRIAIRPVFAYSPLTPSMLRLAGVFDLGAAVVMPAPPGTEIEPVSFGDFGGEWVRPPGAKEGRVILYLHGGGFFTCGLRTHRRLVARIAKRSHAVALSVGYRQLPKAPLSVSMADAFEAYRGLLAQGYAPENIVIAGDSAGGFLAFTTALTAAEQGLPVPSAIVALSPLTDLDHEARASYPHTRSDAYIPAHRLGALKRLLLAGMEDAPSPAPVDRDLRALPPVFMMCGSEEALRHDADLMVERLAEAGVPHRLQIWEGQIHVFQAFAGAVPEGHEAIDEIAAFIRTATTAPSQEDAAA
ncbi:alpha/beta hydrolase [Thermomonospora umbrina]|uniref:Acetyl esterase/lipase n=1 Tax=Thermomonospora umbrina TaxID=111806 RepID=A0A3D9SPG1_9ACTN|nr:alpha/beta hydrolase [Thermomonospora umbrina]REE97798.1 acetyl esterase/lipase [Thermomonospora umbrina]